MLKQLVIILASVATVYGFTEEEIADYYAVGGVENCFSGKTIEVLQFISKYYEAATLQLREFLDLINKENIATKSLVAYNNIVEQGKGTKCQASSSSGHDDDKKKIAEFVKYCIANIETKDLTLLGEVASKDINEAYRLDAILNYNDHNCNKQSPWTEECEKTKKETEAKLDTFQSDAYKAEFINLSKNAFLNSKSALESCVEKQTEDIRTDLDTVTAGIKDCLSKND